jgi:phage terminase large subunit GpA-like protein
MMSRVVVKGEISQTLEALSSEAELVDENGTVLGHFFPANHDQDWAYEGVTDEDLHRRMTEEPTGRSWAEIRRDLEAGLR